MFLQVSDDLYLFYSYTLFKYNRDVVYCKSLFMK